MGLDAEPDFSIVGETSSCEKAMQLIHDLNPDVLVIDLDMPRGDGMALAEMAKSLSPRTAVVMLSIHDDSGTCEKATRAGVSALVLKSLPTTTLFSTIRAVAV
jgi:DNA-binding NarL/FixJ family response regulator